MMVGSKGSATTGLSKKGVIEEEEVKIKGSMCNVVFLIARFFCLDVELMFMEIIWILNYTYYLF